MNLSGPNIPETMLVVGIGKATLVSRDGEVENVPLSKVKELVHHTAFMICHEPGVAARLGLKALQNQFDVLDLFAFTKPAQFCLPTPSGLADVLGLAPPGSDSAAQAATLLKAATQLLADIADPDYPDRSETRQVALTMSEAGWPWGSAVLAALGDMKTPPPGTTTRSGLESWSLLPEWEDVAPPPPPDDQRVSPQETLARLAKLLGSHAEDRVAQRSYSVEVTAAFGPREVAAAPNAVLAEAGTGVGKTLGYIAPATIWAEKNGAAVWLSTYTKNLQRQIDQELDKLFPDLEEKARKVVVRKGRENYLCLLNLEEAVGRAQLVPENKVRLGLIARWAAYTRDGDMVGGDLPAWLLQRLGAARASGLTDRRGECIYAGCAHWRKCYIEHSIRKARGADLVVANHALVMVHAARYGHEEGLPTRYVFDEGHHLFDAADNAFSAHLSGQETAELRRWLRGAESSRRSRARGLETRIDDLVADQEGAQTAMREALRAAAQLPGEGWLSRLAANNPQGPTEKFLSCLCDHVRARAVKPNDAYSLESSSHEPSKDLIEAAKGLENALKAIASPLEELSRRLRQQIVDNAKTLETNTRNRLETASDGVLWRVQSMLTPWRAMLRTIGQSPDEGFIDWFSIDRTDGRDMDAGMHRHWIDPTEPFARAVLEPAHGVVVTSATLRDEAPPLPSATDLDQHDEEITEEDIESTWSRAEMRTGFNHLALPARRSSVASPFDYGEQTRIMIVTDVNRNDMAQVASAYLALFEASGGGGLGLFTAIARLRAIHDRIAEPLVQAGLPLYAQHVDALDPGTLVDIFRAETDTCLLGTDAVRDGVDVPGMALRLIVFDRVPWPRPTIVHRARRDAFGAKGYDDMIARLRLKQAYGRLVRRATDMGVFVMLDSATPSRLLTAFPPGVDVTRLGLADAVAATQKFLSP